MLLTLLLLLTPIDVAAAASTAHVVEALARDYEAAHGQTIRVTVGGSGALARQLRGGAPFEVLLLADEAWSESLLADGLLESARPAIGNALVVIGVRGVDLSGPPPPGRWAIGDPDGVPVGRYARDALRHVGWWDAIAPNAIRVADVRGVIGAIESGDADYGVVYRSDTEMTQTHVVARFSSDAHRPIRYPLGVVRGASDAARDFARWLGSPAAIERFSAAGFTTAVDDSKPVVNSVERPAFGAVIWLSLMIALMGVALALIPGIWLGWLLARRRFPGRIWVEAAVNLPLVLPPVVTGVLLLGVFGRQGLLGGIAPIAFSRTAAVVAAAIIGLPLLVRSAKVAFELVDQRLLDAAATLGMRRSTAWWRIAMPLALPGLVAGVTLAFARAFGEFGATITFAGNIEGETRTLSLAIHTALQNPAGDTLVWQLVGWAVGISVASTVVVELTTAWLRRRAC